MFTSDFSFLTGTSVGLKFGSNYTNYIDINELLYCYL